MIPTSAPYEAVFRETAGGATYNTTMPVEAWSDDGEALVVSERYGGLRPATDLGNFVRVQPASNRYVGAISGGGWTVTHAATAEGGEAFSEPVLAWLVGHDGEMTAVSSDCDGYVETLGRDVDGLTFNPPAGEAVTRPEGPGK